MNFNGVEICSKADLTNLSSKQLIAIYNGATGKATAKFASLGKAYDQTWGAIREAVEASEAAKVAKPAEKPAKSPKAKVAKVAKEKRPAGVFNFPRAGAIEPHRPGTKRAAVIELLSTKAGATLAEVQKAIGWDAKTAYDGVRLLHAYLGYGLKTDADGKIHLVGP